MDVGIVSCTLVAAVLVSGPAKAGHYHARAGHDRARAGHDRARAGHDHARADAGQGAALAPPAPIVEIDASKLKGEPGMLAWSPDGQTLYLQMVERDRKGALTSTRHYLIAIADKTTKSVDGQPAWAGTYWGWKSAPTSPAAASFRIVPSEREEVKRAVAPVGDLAKGGGSGDGRSPTGSSVSEALSAASTAQTLHIWSLKIKDETIGEWVNEAVTPGSSFSWAPAPARAIVYAKRDGGPLTLLDDRGRKRPLAGAKNAFFPAWSDDGARIVWLEKKDRRKYDVMIEDVSLTPQ